MNKQLAIPHVSKIDSKIEYKNKYMTIQSDNLVMSSIINGECRHLNKEYFTVISPDFVVGIVIRYNSKIHDNEILIVNQYRHAIGKMNTEFVAGMIDLETTPYQTIKKELKEEAGILARNIKLLGKCNPLCGRNTNICYVYFINTFKECERKLEEYEQFAGLTMKWITVRKFKNMICNNKITDGVTLMAWGLLLEKENVGSI